MAKKLCCYGIKKILKDINKKITDGGMVFFEIGCSQADAVAALMKEQKIYDIKVEKLAAYKPNLLINKRLTKMFITAPIMVVDATCLVIFLAI